MPQRRIKIEVKEEAGEVKKEIKREVVSDDDDDHTRNIATARKIKDTAGAINDMVARVSEQTRRCLTVVYPRLCSAFLGTDALQRRSGSGLQRLWPKQVQPAQVFDACCAALFDFVIKRHGAHSRWRVEYSTMTLTLWLEYSSKNTKVRRYVVQPCSDGAGPKRRQRAAEEDDDESNGNHDSDDDDDVPLVGLFQRQKQQRQQKHHSEDDDEDANDDQLVDEDGDSSIDDEEDDDDEPDAVQLATKAIAQALRELGRHYVLRSVLDSWLVALTGMKKYDTGAVRVTLSESGASFRGDRWVWEDEEDNSDQDGENDDDDEEDSSDEDGENDDDEDDNDDDDESNDEDRSSSDDDETQLDAGVLGAARCIVEAEVISRRFENAALNEVYESWAGLVKKWKKLVKFVVLSLLYRKISVVSALEVERLIVFFVHGAKVSTADLKSGLFTNLTRQEMLLLGKSNRATTAGGKIVFKWDFEETEIDEEPSAPLWLLRMTDGNGNAKYFNGDEDQLARRLELTMQEAGGSIADIDLQPSVVASKLRGCVAVAADQLRGHPYTSVDLLLRARAVAEVVARNPNGATAKEVAARQTAGAQAPKNSKKAKNKK